MGELFDLETDPEEVTDLAGDPAHAKIVEQMEQVLRSICDPNAMNDLAFADQDRMIAGYGGAEAAIKLGASAATPPPKVGA